MVPSLHQTDTHMHSSAGIKQVQFLMWPPTEATSRSRKKWDVIFASMGAGKGPYDQPLSRKRRNTASLLGKGKGQISMPVSVEKGPLEMI